MESAPQSRYFEFREAGGGKFWEITQAGTQVRVRFGKIGSRGQTRERTLESEEIAARDTERSIRAKLAKGYEECDERDS